MIYAIKILIFGLMFIASAQSAPDCNQPQTTADMRDCAAINLDQSDHQLNAVYGKLMKKLDDEGQRKLKESQRSWIKFRDLNATFLADLNRGGTMEPLTYITTKAEMTDRRVQELTNELNMRE